MATNVHNSKWLLLALLSLASVAGCCCQALPLPGENECPTDARRLYCTCGEEAVRRCPCGPDREFYGLKPTCWREWPEGWQCNGCEGSPYIDRALCAEPVAEESVVEAPVRKDVDLSNPFRPKAGAAELPLPPQTPEVAPKQITPVQTAPVQLIPAQPTPAAPPALEKVPTETVPPAKTSAIEKAKEQATSVAAAPPKTESAAPPITPIAEVEATVPNPMPVVPAAVKMTAAAPLLIAPLNAPATPVAVAKLEPKPEPKPVQVAAAPKIEKKSTQKKAEISTTKDRAEAPAPSSRIEQHLLNNLRL